MFRGRFLGFFFIMLLVVGLLSLAGSSIYRAGWTQGYFTGKVADGETTVGAPAAGAPEAGVPEAAPGQPVHYGRGFSPARDFFGTVVKCFVLLLAIGIFFKFMGFFMWRNGGHGGWHKGGGHGRWRKHGHWGKHHDHTPPWYDDEADEPMKA